MARVNIDILGVSELKWTGMGKFNSDDHFIYHCGQGEWLGCTHEVLASLKPTNPNQALLILWKEN